jgi:hypothetical protein
LQSHYWRVTLREVDLSFAKLGDSRKILEVVRHEHGCVESARWHTVLSKLLISVGESCLVEWNLLGSQQFAHINVRDGGRVLQGKSAGIMIGKAESASEKRKSLQSQSKSSSERTNGCFCLILVGKLMFALASRTTIKAKIWKPTGNIESVCV